MPLFQPNIKPLSLSKLFHCFWPHTLLHSHQFLGMRFAIKTHKLLAVSQPKSRSQTQIHRDIKSQTQISTNPSPRFAEREREREAKSYTTKTQTGSELGPKQTPNQIWIATKTKPKSDLATITHYHPWPNHHNTFHLHRSMHARGPKHQVTSERDCLRPDCVKDVRRVFWVLTWKRAFRSFDLVLHKQ